MHFIKVIYHEELIFSTAASAFVGVGVCAISCYWLLVCCLSFGAYTSRSQNVYRRENPAAKKTAFAALLHIYHLNGNYIFMVLRIVFFCCCFLFDHKLIDNNKKKSHTFFLSFYVCCHLVHFYHSDCRFNEKLFKIVMKAKRRIKTETHNNNTHCYSCLTNSEQGMRKLEQKST